MTTKTIQSMEKIKDRLLFNFLASGADNAEQVMEAARGFAVPGIVSTDFAATAEAAARVAELKKAAPVISIGLGGGGDLTMWSKVIDIALLSNPGHINQPFHTSGYAQGIFRQAAMPQYINGLVAPSGKPGIVKLAGGREMEVELFVELASMMNIVSIKVMPVQGVAHLEELVHIAKVAARNGIYGIEPAGGIHAGNIRELVSALLATDISFVMPHVFGNTIDPVTGRTLPEKVEEVVRNVLN
jgi:2-dehydro-3-deoxy-phosphogluconate aldolase